METGPGESWKLGRFSYENGEPTGPRNGPTDHGVGMESKDLEHVFEEFWQAGTRDTAHRQGMGLGLAIARHIAVGHGGTLTASSPGTGLGSTFVLRVPLQAAV